MRKVCWRRDRLPTPVFLGFPCGSAGKEFACNAGDLGSVPGLGRSPGEGKGFPLQYSGLEDSMDCTVHGVAKSRTWLSDFQFHFQTQLQVISATILCSHIYSHHILYTYYIYSIDLIYNLSIWTLPYLCRRINFNKRAGRINCLGQHFHIWKPQSMRSSAQWWGLMILELLTGWVWQRDQSIIF